MSEEKQGKDIFGVRPIGEALKSVTDAVIAGASAFLGRICLPAAEEIGLLLRDKVRTWRVKNFISIVGKTELLLGKETTKHAHPRVVSKILEYGSWTEDDEVQSLWAGLLASSCTDDGNDETNLMFIDLLSRLTTSQVKILDYICKNSELYRSEAGWIMGGKIILTADQLQAISKIEDFQRLDRELDHMRSMHLISPVTGGFVPEKKVADVSPTSLALHMYARCNGFQGDPCEFFKV